MAYLITQIVFSLALAGVVGGVIGWLINGYRAGSRQQQNQSELMRQSLLLNQAETDNKMMEEDFRELKHRSEETITLLKEEGKQIPELKKNLEKSQTLVRQLLQKHDAELRQLSSENSVLKNKLRELENREKAVTRLQMDLNTERLKMRSDGVNHGSGKSSLQPEQTQQDSTSSNAEHDQKPALTQQTEIPLSSEVVHKPESGSNSIDDILDKADDVLTRFRDDPSVELDAFQLELDQELDAIRDDLKFESSILTELPDSGSVDTAAPASNDSDIAPSRSAEVPVLHKSTQVDDSDYQTLPPATEPEPVSESETDPVEQDQYVSAGTHTPFHQVFGPGFTQPAHTDDLQQIFGIGPVTERTLNAIGIVSYEQLAKFNREHIEYVAEVLQIFPGRIERDNWVGSALKIVSERESGTGSVSEKMHEHSQNSPTDDYANRLEDA